MPLRLVQLVSDSFNRPDENPLNPAAWSVVVNSGSSVPIVPLQVVGNQCVQSTIADWNWEAYTGISWPNDQWCGVKIINLDSTADLEIIIRQNSDGSNCYGLVIGNNLDGTFSLELIRFDNVNQGAILYQNNIIGNLGDEFILAGVGSHIYVLQNRNVLSDVVDGTYPSGVVSVFEVSSIQMAVDNFVGGQAFFDADRMFSSKQHYGSRGARSFSRTIGGQ